MSNSTDLNSLNFIKVQVQFRRFRRNATGNFPEFGTTTPDYGTHAFTLWRTVFFTQTASIVTLKGNKSYKVTASTSLLPKTCQEMDTLEKTAVARDSRKK